MTKSADKPTNRIKLEAPSPGLFHAQKEAVMTDQPEEVEPVTEENDLGEGPPVDAEDEHPDEADAQ